MNHSFSFSVTGFRNLCFPSKEAYPAGKVAIKNDKMKDMKTSTLYSSGVRRLLCCNLYVANNRSSKTLK